MIYRSNESSENSGSDGCLDVDNSDEHEHWIFASNFGTTSQTIQFEPRRFGIDVRH